MLKLKKHHTITIPSFLTPAHHMQMSPVTSDDDELIDSIDNDQRNHDDNWTLEQRPDTEELTSYWNTVEKDIANDPQWIRFDDD